MLFAFAVWGTKSALILRRRFRSTPEARHKGRTDIHTIQWMSNGAFWSILLPLGALAGLLTITPPPAFPATLLSWPGWAVRTLAAGLASLGYFLMFVNIIIKVVQFSVAARLHGPSTPKTMLRTAQQYWHTFTARGTPSMTIAVAVISTVVLSLIRGSVPAPVLAGLVCYPLFVMMQAFGHYVRPVSVLLLAGSSHDALLLATRVRLVTVARVATLLDSSQTQVAEVAGWHSWDSFRTPDNVEWRRVVAALEQTALLIVVDLRTPSPALLIETQALLASGQAELDRVIFVIDRPPTPVPVRDMLRVDRIDARLIMRFTTTPNLPGAASLFLRGLQGDPKSRYDRCVVSVSAEQSVG
jgi:hypothetical protein